MLSLSSEHAATSSHEAPALPEHASPSSTGLPNDGSQHPGEAPKKSSWLRILILVLVIGGAIGFVVYRIRTNHSQAAGAGAPGGTGGRRGGGANAITPVSFDLVTKRTIPISLTALGTVTAYNTVTLKSRVDGQIIRVNFQEGQRVRQGQSLIEIDPQPYLATLSVAKGNLTRDQANAALAQVQSQRYNQLYAAGVVSKESTQTQEATAGQSVGTLAADRAAIQQAQVNVNYTHITSPISGIVGLRQVDVGNIVSASGTTGLVVITQVQPISVIFTLPEDQLPAVFSHMRSGRKLIAEAWDRANTVKLATGSLLTVDNQIDTTTGTAKLKAVFVNTDNALYPNQFVNIHLILENRADSLVIPAAAIQTGNNGSFVYVIDRTQGQAVPSAGAGRPGGASSNPTADTGAPRSRDAGTVAEGGGPVGDAPNGAHQSAGGQRAGGAGGQQMSYPVKVVTVVIDSTQGTDVILKSGLQAGQQVVTDGQEKLQNNSRVIARPSSDMVAARQARANGGAAVKDNPNPGAGDFSNGRGSDRDAGPAAPGSAGPQGGRRRPQGSGQ
ncbi:MAG: efflux RND transporter periplasmic adaptor subunit [Janthinobacterium lividum]